MAATQELRKALDTSVTNGGNNLLPYDLEPTLSEELLKLQPLAELIQVAQANGKTHEYTLRTSHPQGWFEGESTGANNKNSTYARKSTMLKINRIWGSVTGFAQTFDAPFIDALATELEGSLEGMGDLMEYGLLWACSGENGFTGDAYQYEGIFPRIAKLAPENIIDAGGAKVSLDFLDQAVGKISGYRQSRNDPKMWLMGMRMRQITDGLQTRIQIPITSTTIQDGKIVMNNYDGAPIWESDFVVPGLVSTSPAATAVIAAGTTLADATYKYQIASITMLGEQVAGTVSADCVVVAPNKKVELTWTHDDDAKLYLIFRKKDAEAYKLLDIVPALTYDAAGAVTGVVEAYTDDGSKTPVAVKPLAAGEQNIFLLNRNPEHGVSFLGKVDDMGRQVGKLVSFVELARIKDTYDYMLKQYSGTLAKYPNISAAVVRHVKTA